MIRLFMLFALGLAGCSSVTARLPLARFDSPEAPGRHHLRVAGGASNVQELSFFDTSTVVATTSPAVTEGVNPIDLGAGFGVTNALETGVDVQPFYVAAAVKYQLLGDSAYDAKAGNFSLSAQTKVGLVLGSAGGDFERGWEGADSFYNHGGRSGSARMTPIEVGLIAGYRPLDNGLMAIHAYYSIAPFYATISPTRTEDVTQPPDTTFDSQVHTFGATLNYWFFFGRKEHQALVLSAGLQKLEWPGGPTRIDEGVGLAYSFLVL